MADQTDAEKKAQADSVKALVKEALSEWQTEEATRRTEADKNKPKDGGFFGGLFS